MSKPRRNRAHSQELDSQRQLERAILRVGGRNPHGRPLYRVILAQERRVLAHGAWSIWDENLTPDERGGLGIQIIQQRLKQFNEVMQAAVQTMPRHTVEAMAQDLSAEIDDLLNEKLNATPIRVDMGMAEVPLYPFEGWILEKWKPAESFGPPSMWEMYRFNGENALGPYPYSGDYELVAGPTPHPLTIKQAEDAIREDFKTIQSRPFQARQRVAWLLERQERQRKQRQRERRNQIEALMSELPDRRSLKASQMFKEVLEDHKLESVLVAKEVGA